MPILTRVRDRLLAWALFGRWRYTNLQRITWRTHVQAYAAAVILELLGRRG